jgi:nicotinamidase-related amidase
MIKGNAALLVIDMQHDFLDKGAPVHCVGGMEMVPKVKTLVKACRDARIPVIFTQEVHRPTRIDMGRELDGNEPDHCLLGTRGVEIHQELQPTEDDYHVRKARYDAFLGTDLQFLLNGLMVLPHDTLIICGVASNVCVHYTAAAGHQRDYRLKVVEDCCAGSTVEEHEAALTQINYLQNGSRVSLDEILKDIEAYGRQKTAPALRR